MQEEVLEFSVAHKRKYSSDHLWLQDKEDRFTIGISDFLAKDMGEVLRVILPHADTEINIDDELFSVCFTDGTVVFRSRFSGIVLEVNGEAEINPELLYDDPYNDGWCMIFKPHLMDADQLMEPDEYIEYLANS